MSREVDGTMSRGPAVGENSKVLGAEGETESWPMCLG